MKKGLENKNNIIVGALWFFIFAIILSLCFMVYQRIQDRKYDEIIQDCVPSGVLTYGADDSAPPLRFVDDDGVYKGVVVDYINQLSLELGIEIKTVPYKWDDAISTLKEGKTDLCDMFVNEERAEFFTFTDPIYTLRTVVVTLGSEDYRRENINSMTVATQKGDYANSYMKKNFPNAELVYVHDVGEGIKLLLDGKVDGVIGDEPVVSFYAAQLDANDRLTTIGTSIYEEPVCLALPKTMEKLVPILNKAIKNINDKGSLEKIQQKWFGISTPLITTRSGSNAVNVLVIVAVAFACAILLVQLNNRSLREQVNNRTRELAERKDELQLIFDQMPEGVILADEHGHILNWSYSFFRKNISEEAAHEGVKCFDFLKVYCGNPKCSGLCGKEANCIITETLEKGNSVIKKVDALSAVYEVRAVPAQHHESSNSNRAVLIVVRDITLDEVNSRKLMQSSKMIAIGQLAGGMAHQIRNPLGIIRTQSFIIRNEYGDDNIIKKSLDYIDDSVKRASEIIDNVMNFWRVSDDRQTAIPIRQLMESVVMLQEKDFVSSNIAVEIQCDPHLELISSEESLKHILHNLVSNSVDAMKSGGKLTLKAMRDEGFIQLICRDTGCGISEKNMVNLFNPFFTTKEPGKGTGLGLFIVYSEVEKAGGTIEVESREGQGTTFLIRLPEKKI